MEESLFDSDGKLDMEFTLINFDSRTNVDLWRVRDAFEGVQVFGGIGSGKSSGSGKTIANSFLKNGFGGLVMCAKKGEALEWLNYAMRVNRWDDIIVFGKKNKFEIWSNYLADTEQAEAFENFNNRHQWEAGNDRRFNPLQYELKREGEGAGEVFNISNLFMEIYKMGNRFSGGGGGSSERYWDAALRRCLDAMIQTLILAKEEVSVKNMRELIVSAPLWGDNNSYPTTDEEIMNLANSSYCAWCVYTALENAETEEQQEQQSLIHQYFLNEFATLDDKTRSIVKESFLGLAQPFTSGILKTYFSEGVNLFPEVTFEGKIILLDFSVKEYLQAGVYAQGIFKLLWQQAIERRDVKKHPLPAFLWVDESQYFVSEYDTIFQTTARSSRACTVFLTQNISNYYSQMGGASSKSKVDSLLGNLSTKIFHANNDSVTNEWASNVIGKDLITLESRSEQRERLAVFAKTTGTNKALSLLPQILPMEFTTLSSGGKSYNFIVQAIIQMKGRKWSNGKNYNMVEFSQR